jgi:hypothetical protein
LAFDVHPGNARRVRVTINERTLADSLGPAPKRIGSPRVRRDVGFEPNIMHAVEGWAFVQDNGPERVDVKRDLLARIFLPADSLIATSSSGSDRPPGCLAGIGNVCKH